MDLLQETAEWIESVRLAALSSPTCYLRKDGSCVKVNATLGKTVFRAENEYGVTVRTETRDFLISVDDLPDDPEGGDTILYDRRIYEVLAPNGVPAWRWSGTSHLVRRIHTKEIKVSD